MQARGEGEGCGGTPPSVSCNDPQTVSAAPSSSDDALPEGSDGLIHLCPQPSPSLVGEMRCLEIPGAQGERRCVCGAGQEGWRGTVLGKGKDCPVALRLAGQVAVKKGSVHVLYRARRLPAWPRCFRPGPVGLRDSRMLGPGRGSEQTP